MKRGDEAYCLDCRESNPCSNRAFDVTGKDGKRTTHHPGGLYCGACGSERIVDIDSYRAQIEAQMESER